MKPLVSCHRLAVILFAVGLPLPSALAAPAPARMFEGIDLAKLRQTQQLKAMPEVYELDPATRRYKLRETTLQLPLAGAWITYNPTLGVFYLNNVPNEKSGSYFGPIEGDAIETFKLEDKMIAKLRQDYAGDELQRVSLMMRSGHPYMRECALRIMKAALAPDVSGHVRAYHVGKIRELTEGLKGDDVTPVVAAVQQTEKRIEEITDAIPDEQYSSGNDALEKQGKLREGMKPSVAVPEGAWGTPVQGLRVAAAFSSVTPEMGAKMTVWLLVENVSDREIKFGSSDVIQSARAVVKGTNNAEVRVSATWHTGMSPILRHKLQPQERLTLAVKNLAFNSAEGGQSAGFGGGLAVAGPGEYRVRYESVLGGGSSWSRNEADGEMHRTYPAKGEWSGMLATGETVITVSPKP